MAISTAILLISTAILLIWIAVARGDIYIGRNGNGFQKRNTNEHKQQERSRFNNAITGHRAKELGKSIISPLWSRERRGSKQRDGTDYDTAGQGFKQRIQEMGFGYKDINNREPPLKMRPGIVHGNNDSGRNSVSAIMRDKDDPMHWKRSRLGGDEIRRTTDEPEPQRRAAFDESGECSFVNVVDKDHMYYFLEVDPRATEPPFNCKNACVYRKEKGGRFCFPDVVDMEAESIDVSSSGIVMMGGSVDDYSVSNNVQILGNCSGYSDSDLRFFVNRASAAKIGGNIYICGGESEEEGGGVTDACQLRDMAGNYSKGPSLNVKRTDFTMATVGSTLVAVGGLLLTSILDSVEVFDPVSNNWTIQNYVIDPGRFGLTSVAIGPTSMLLIGGSSNTSGVVLTTTEELNMKTGNFTAYPNLPRPATHISSVLYAGKVYIAGGEIDNFQESAEVWSLDLRARNWTSLPSMLKKRHSSVIAVINGKITVYSGFGEGSKWLEELVGGKWVEREIASWRFGSSWVTC